MTSKDVKQLREDLGLSIRKFADEIGVDKVTVLNWEHDRTSPKGPALKLLRLLEKRLKRRRGRSR